MYTIRFFDIHNGGFDLTAIKAKFAVHLAYCTLLYSTDCFQVSITNQVTKKFITFTTEDINIGKFAMLQKLQQAMLGKDKIRE